MKRGFITVAQNSQSGDYVRMAYALALSLKATQSKYHGLTIMVDSVDDVPDQYRDAFDQIVEIPWGDDAASSRWKIHNKWKVIHCSPYDETILVDADMLFPSDICDWWDILATRDVWACTSPVDFRGNKITNTVYRKAFDENGIPHVYTAFLFFKKTHESYEFFERVRYCTREWDDVRYNMLPGKSPKQVSGDLAFGTAMLIGNDEPLFTTDIGFPTFVHMKTQLITSIEPRKARYLSDDWTSYLQPFMTPDLKLTIGGYIQTLPFHYHVKSFMSDHVVDKLERYHEA